MTRPDLSLPARYRTIWPALTARYTRWLFARLYRGCALGKTRWVRGVTSALLGTLPALVIVTCIPLLAALCLLWPFGWLIMLPTRIAVRRGVTQLNVVYALCWLLLPWVALLMAVRDAPINHA